MKGICAHPLDSDRRLLVQGCCCSACSGTALKHVDFHTSPGANIPRAVETDWAEAVDSQQLSGS